MANYRSKQTPSNKNFFSTNPFLVLLGFCLVATSIFLWRTQESRNLSQIGSSTESKARSYVSETEIRYSSIYQALERLAARDIPREETAIVEWEKDAAFYIDAFVGLNSIAWVDGTFHIRQIVPLQDNSSSLNQLASAVKGTPAEINLWVPSYDGEEFQGYIWGVIDVGAFIAPVLSEIDDDYMLQLLDEGLAIFASDNWQPSQEKFVISRMITFENTTVLNLIFAPTAELLHSEIVHANRTFLLGLLFSGITLSAVYIAQNFNTIAILSELRYRNLFEASQDAIFIINLQGEYQDVNPAATEMVGYSLLELQEMLVDDLRIPSAEVSPEVRSRMWREGGMQELSLRHKDGHPIPVDLVVSPIREGEVQKYVLGIVRDISERKRAEKELQKYRDHLEELVEIRTVELEAVNAELKDFAYVVSHDLKAPLRAITQLGSWIATDYAEALDADGRELVDLLIGRTRRMHGLIQGILQYSRIGRVVEKKRSVNLNQLVQETLEMLAPPASIQITVTNELPTVVGERARLRQVFQNLLDNALKFMDKPQGWVRIGCADAGDYWLFSVADNGPGIAAKYYAKIFQIFQTLVPRDEFESTGIGLALVKKIVELNEGKVWVESTVGAGSTFYFTLPKQEEER